MTPKHSPEPGEQTIEEIPPKRFSSFTLIAACCVFFVAGIGISHGVSITWRYQATLWRAVALDYKALYEEQLSSQADGSSDKWQGLVEEPLMPPLQAPEIDPESTMPAPGVGTVGVYI